MPTQVRAVTLPDPYSCRTVFRLYCKDCNYAVEGRVDQLDMMESGAPLMVLKTWDLMAKKAEDDGCSHIRERGNPWEGVE